MSLANYVASITVPTTGPSGSPSPGSVFPFSIARTNNGAILDRAYTELEELTTPGVDGRRWRQLRTYFPSFTLETWADFSSYTNAITACRNYWLSQGQFVTLTWYAGGFVGVYFQVKVIDVQSQAMAGVMGGFGADPASAALVHANWTLAVQAVEGVNPQ